ncbi:MAG: carboxylate-amine ligase, partial [Planctomycetota bacterium]
MTRSLGLFEGYGIEIESMVVDADTLEVRSIVDLLLREFAGSDEWVGDVEAGEIAISNEFVAHVVELKTNGPAKSYSGLESEFRGCSTRLNELLREWNARLLPTAMHPWMNPVAETEFWSHDNSPIYRAYHALFDARRHGWANLQSVHLNLPFADEREFAKLMAAIRLVLPLIPALAASSPIVEGNATGMLDNRLHFYRTNSERVSAMTGEVIPEAIFDVETYRKVVLGAIDVQLKERGASQVLMGNEWTNARGAIARFDRMAIEIRLIDA